MAGTKRAWCLVLAGVLASACLGGESPARLKPGETLLTVYTAGSGVLVSARVDASGVSTPSHVLIEEEARKGGLAVVRQCRRIALPEGVSEYRFTDVPAMLDAATLRFVDQTDPKGTRIVEQNFLYDLVNQTAMLKRFVDRPVELVDSNRRSYSGVLLSDGYPLTLLTRRKAVEMVNYDTEKGSYVLRFPELPENFVTRPTLVWRIRAKQAGDHDVVAAYQTGGLAWRTDYTAVVNPGDTRMDLSGWVTIANVSGARFANARIKLVAGDIRRIAEVDIKKERRGYEQAEKVEKKRLGDHRELFEHYLYALPHRTSVENNQTKQIELLNATDIPVKKTYTYDALVGTWRLGDYRRDETYGIGGRRTVRVNLQFDNTQAASLGMPLPAGIVRVNKIDAADGSLEFIGEDCLDHAPNGARIRLYVGDAFDIVGQRVQKDFKWLERNHLRESFEIELRNHKDEAITVHVLEHLYRWENWEIEKNTLPYKKLDSGTIEFAVPVKANAKATIAYTAHYWWPLPAIRIEHVEKKEEAEQKKEEKKQE